MPSTLPSEIDYRRLLVEGGVLAGSIAPARLARVSGNIRAAGAVAVRVGIRRDAQGRTLLEGEFTAPLEARCQRCLEWMPLEIAGPLTFVVHDLEQGPVTDGEDADEDVVEARAGRLAIVTLVEDEVLLACPMIPLHAAHACAAGDAMPEADDARYKPFAALGELLGRRDDDR